MVPRAEDVIRRIRAAGRGTPALRTERRELSKEIANAAGAEVLRLAESLIAARAPRFVAYELVLHHAEAMNAITLQDVERLGQGMAAWWDVDSFGCLLAGPAWRIRRIGDAAIQNWARSEDWCWRRAALVSTVPLKDDAKRTLKIARMLIADRHDMIVKALSWALRELSKRDPESVRRFVETHREKLAARVIREVMNKIETGLKNPRR